MDFDLQRFLQDMEQRAEDRHNRLEEKMDDCLQMVADHEVRVTVIEQIPIASHETRLVRVEGVIKSLKWVVVTVLGSGITAGLGMLFNRLSGGITK